MNFVNRVRELEVLEKWWSRPGPGMGLVYGRRRVGKTALITEFAKNKRSVLHAGHGRPLREELAEFTQKLPSFVDRHGRTLVNWAEAISVVADAAKNEPALLVLDEFQELMTSDPHIEGTMRAVWEEVLRSGSRLKLLLSGSAVRTMWAIGEARKPLYGRFDFHLLVHPFRPHETALLLRDLKPADRAVVWGICGGTPMYLWRWDQGADLAHNIRELFCSPEAFLYNEAQLLLLTDGAASGLTKQVLSAIALGKNRHSEIVEAVTGDRQVARVLDDLEKLRLVERVLPVTDDPRARTGRTMYRISDNYLAFWLSVVERHSYDIERSLGASAAKAIGKRINDFMGPRYEEAFRDHLRRSEGLRVGPYWTRGGIQAEIDAVVLNEEEIAVAVGECKWEKVVNASSLRAKLIENARRLPKVVTEPQLIVGAREQVTDAGGIRGVTASDIFV